MVAEIEEKKRKEILSGTLKFLEESGEDEDAVEYVMGFNPKRLFHMVIGDNGRAKVMMIECIWKSQFEK